MARSKKTNNGDINTHLNTSMFGEGFFSPLKIPSNPVKAFKLYLEEGQLGNVDVQFNLGVSYENGDGVKQNLKEAVKWYRKAAEQGDADAQYCLGRMYEGGEGVAENLKEAAKWHRKSAEQGFVEAQGALGAMYLYGVGVEPSLEEATYWFSKADEQGDEDSKSMLPVVQRLSEMGDAKGKEFAKSTPEEVEKWVRKTAGQVVGTVEQDVLEWKDSLVRSADRGKNADPIVLEEIKSFCESFEKEMDLTLQRISAVNKDDGDKLKLALVDAQCLLGDMYAYGEGVKQNPKKAVKWYRMAAEQGHAGAQNGLGTCYANGKGVKRDLVEALKWFQNQRIKVL